MSRNNRFNLLCAGALIIIALWALTMQTLAQTVDAADDTLSDSRALATRSGAGMSANLVSQWPFDDGSGTTAANSITNLLDGSLNGGAAWSTDVAPLLTANPYAIAFDGATGFVEIPDDNAIDFDTNQDFTVAFWTKPAATQNPTGSNADNAILEKWSDGPDPYPYVVRYLNQLSGGDEGKVFVARYDGTLGTGIKSTVAINDGSYHHVALVRGGGSSGTLSLYIDGVLQNSIPDVVSASTTNTSPLFVGKRGNDINYYNGLVDDLRIYSGALTSNEVVYLGAGCADISTTVATEAELNDAITCFNNIAVAGTYTITLTADINLTASTTAIDNSTTGVELTIEGDGYTVDGQDISGVRPFQVAANTLVIMNQITVTNGMGSGNGGAIANDGILTIQNSTFSGNSTEAGGGIYNAGTLTVTNSTFSANATDDAEGGGIYNDSGPLTVTNSTFSGNFAAGGGGIFNFSGPLMVTNSTFSNNSSTFSAGAIYNLNGTLTVTHSTFADNAASTGGSLLNTGTAYLAGVILETGANGANCVGTFNDNGHNLSDDASCGFSGTSADNATLNLGALSVTTTPGQQVHTPTDPSDAIGAIPAGTTVNNNGATLACNGTTTDQLGSNRPVIGSNPCTSGAVEVAIDICPTPLAISDTAELANCITWANANPGADTLGLDANITLSAALPQITSEITLEGAGYSVDGANTYRIFYVVNTGNLTVNQITVQNGSATDGSGIFNLGGTVTVTHSTFSGNSASYGGSIYSELGTTTVTHSTFSNNNAIVWGGGILMDSGTLTVTHSTFSGNSSSRGGGIYNDNGTATVTHSTFSGNSATTAGGSIHNLGDTIYLAGVILDTGTSGANCEIYSGTLEDNGYNLSDDASCSFSGTSANNATLNLSALSITTTPGQRVHTPQAGSAAIGAIPAGITVDNNGVTLACNGTTTDQLGNVRPINVGDDCTAGAVEVGCVAPVAPAVSIAISGTQVQLSWTGTAAAFDVFRSNQPYFTPAVPYAGGVSSAWLDPDTTSIGDVGNNYFYVLQAASACGQTTDSKRIGEFDFALVPGN